MNNNDDDHGDHENGDDGERRVLAWWASDAILAAGSLAQLLDSEADV